MDFSQRRNRVPMDCGRQINFGEVRQAPKRLGLQDSNITRYEKEFVELSLLAVGKFGLVY